MLRKKYWLPWLGLIVLGLCLLPARSPAPGAVSRPALTPTPGSAGLASQSQPAPDPHWRDVALWPVDPLEVAGDARLSAWLDGGGAGSYAARDQLLADARALAWKSTSLVFQTDEPLSALILVGGKEGEVEQLLEQLEQHPLLVKVSRDDPDQREVARQEWNRAGRPPVEAAALPTGLTVHVRSRWASNVVWGQAVPGEGVFVRLFREGELLDETYTQSTASGRWDALLKYDIEAGDELTLDSGAENRILLVPEIQAQFGPDRSTLLVQFSGMGDVALELVLGSAQVGMAAAAGEPASLSFSPQEAQPGDRGFLSLTAAGGTDWVMPLAVPVVNVRRATNTGLPFRTAHDEGITSVVWGAGNPSASYTVTLTRGGETVSRSGRNSAEGEFSISMDRAILAGDQIEYQEGANRQTIFVPEMSYHVDALAKSIYGFAPANISATGAGEPHSLNLVMGSSSLNATTNGSGAFAVNFVDENYLAGRLGYLRYTNPDGNSVYLPVFGVEPARRGVSGDGWADVVLGKPDFNHINFNRTVGSHLFNPQGVAVDRSTLPNRVYVYDSGNNRILGLSHLGVCAGGPAAGGACTSSGDCPSSTCQYQEERPADLVLGQPDLTSNACNGDSGYQSYPDTPPAAAGTLCLLREEQLSISEGGSGASMTVDGEGNLYVTDFFNNRVLRYDRPFETDSVADAVWGQVDFSGTACNHGNIIDLSSANGLCLTPPPGVGDLRAGAAVDSQGNVWVADNQNNRVVRFPAGGQQANLVLGQPNFTSTAEGSGMNQMARPSAVAVIENGSTTRVYVADSMNHRVLIFQAPFSSGMRATSLLNADFDSPSGLGRDASGGLWVTDNGHDRFVHFNASGVMIDAIEGVDDEGGVGVDVEGNLLAGGWNFQSLLLFAAPGYENEPTARLLRSEGDGIINQTDAGSLYGGQGLEVAGGQLIHGDESRLLFWNDPYHLSSGQPADGFIGEPDFSTRSRWGQRFQRMRADPYGILWVIFKNQYDHTSVRGYELPLYTGQTPLHEIHDPLPVLGGGTLTFSTDFFLGGIDTQPGCVDCLWLSDEGYHRAFRIRNASTNPYVDIILGQRSVSAKGCNQGRDGNYSEPRYPTRDSLCHPGALSFDRQGNLYLSDSNLEFDGNQRMLVWEAGAFPTDLTSVLLAVPADHVLGRGGSFTRAACLPLEEDPMCGSWEPAFDSQGNMLVGFNAYMGPRFPMMYGDPLNRPFPTSALGDFSSQPMTARFDEFDNLYIADHNRSRILIYWNAPPETYLVTGVVQDEQGQPVEGVEVTVVGYSASGISVADGSYRLENLLAGSYRLHVHKTRCTFEPPAVEIHVPADTVVQKIIATCSDQYRQYLPLGVLEGR